MRHNAADASVPFLPSRGAVEDTKHALFFVTFFFCSVSCHLARISSGRTKSVKMVATMTFIKFKVVCIVFSLLARQGQCFPGACLITRKHSRSKSPSCPLESLQARRRNKSLDDDDGDKTEESIVIPQLPAFGGSSFTNDSTEIPAGKSQFLNTENTDAAFVSPKFKLQYTCNVCDTRNAHLVSRIAYRSGMVIAICKGCKSKHLIADNLNETPGLDGDSNIEDYFKARGMGDSVNRVTPEVFGLEHILRFNSNSGSLVGDDGNPVLE